MKLTRWHGYSMFVCFGLGFIVGLHSLNVQHTKELSKSKAQICQLREDNERLSDKVRDLKRIMSNKGTWLAIDKQARACIVQWVLNNSDRCSPRLASDIVSWCDDKKLCFVLLALMQVESRFNPTAVSKAKAIGLGQIMPLWVPELKKEHAIDGLKDLYDPMINITCTEYILKKYLKATHNDLTKALHMYSGHNSKEYVQAVYANMGQLMMLLDFGKEENHG